MDKVLVVDDESDIVNLLKLVLGAEGYNVTSATSGDDALNLASIECPDMVLLDLMMPGRSGVETCRELKKQSRTRNIPVIVFSALGRDVDRKMTKDAGASVHLTKPFDNKGLLTEVKRCLNEAKAWKFSRQVGVEHSKIEGRKILLEFDPRTGYERVVRDFALEWTILGAEVIVISKRSSGLREAFGGDQEIRFLDLDRPLAFLSILKENPDELPAIIFDSLTDLLLNETSTSWTDHLTAYQFVQEALQAIADPRITAMFLLNSAAHEPKELASLRGMFAVQLVYDKGGLGVTRFA